FSRSRKGNMDGTITDNNLAIAIKPRLEITYYNRGNAYFTKKELNRALGDFNTAIEIQPDFAMAYCNRGSVYIALGAFERAIDDYDQAIQLKPQLAIAYRNRGLAQLLLRRELEAEKNFARYLTLNSQSRPAIEQLIKTAKERMRTRPGISVGFFFEGR